MARYLVENSRPRQIVTLFGKVLASCVSSRWNRPGKLWLSEAQHASAPVQRLLDLRRLRLVEVDSEDDGPVDVPLESPPPLEEPAVEEPAVEVVIENDPAEGFAPAKEKREKKKERKGEKREPPVQPSLPSPEAAHYTRAELESLTHNDLRGLAKTLGLSPGGKVAEVVARILAAQETP